MDGNKKDDVLPLEHEYYVTGIDMPNKTKEEVLELVKKDGRRLMWASKKLKNDREVCLEAIKQNWSAISSVSSELRSDKQFILEAMKIEPRIYYSISRPSLRYDDEIQEIINKYLNLSKMIEQLPPEVELSTDRTGKTR